MNKNLANKWLGLCAVVAVYSLSASADPYGTAGCGLGSIVFQDQPGPIQIVAATVNGTFGSQTFGITTGTSNCTPRTGRVAAETFITINRVALEKDAARGEGESIRTLSTVLKCEDAAAFSSLVSGNFEAIFGNTESRSQDVLSKVETAVKAHNNAAKCAVFG